MWSGEGASPSLRRKGLAHLIRGELALLCDLGVAGALARSCASMKGKGLPRRLEERRVGFLHCEGANYKSN